MSASFENSQTVKDRIKYKKYRAERRDTAELRERFEREQYKAERAMLEYLRTKGELE